MFEIFLQGDRKGNYCVLRLLAIHFQRLPSNKLPLRNTCIRERIRENTIFHRLHPRAYVKRACNFKN